MSLGAVDKESENSEQKSRCYQSEMPRSDKPRCSLTRHYDAENSSAVKNKNQSSPVSKKNSLHRVSSSSIIRKSFRNLISEQHSDSDIIQPTQDTSPRMPRHDQLTLSERSNKSIKDPVMSGTANSKQVNIL